MNPNRKNLANAFLANPITDTATTMVYQTGYGSGKPAVPYFDTLTPAGQLSTMGNSEIVQVTALSGDTATIVRARKGTTAKAFPAGTIASNGIYVEDKVGSENIDFTALVDAGNGWKYDTFTRTYYYLQDNISSINMNGNGTVGDQAQFGSTINPPTGFSNFQGFAVDILCAAGNMSQLQDAVRTNSTQTYFQVWIRNVWTSSTNTGVGKVSAIAKLL